MAGVRILRVELTEYDVLRVHLDDGRVCRISLSRVPELAGASVATRYQWQLVEDGGRVRWASLGLDLTASQLLAMASAGAQGPA